MVNDFKNYFQNMFSSTTSPETTNNGVNGTSEEETKPGTSENGTSEEEETKPGTSENGTSENRNENNQVGGKKHKKKKKSLKLKKKKKKTARKTKSKKNKTKDRKHGSGACQGKPQPEEQQWKPKSGDIGIQKYYGQYVTVEGLNGRKDVGKLIRMNSMGNDRSIVLKGDNGSIIQWVDIKSVTHPDKRIGEI